MQSRILRGLLALSIGTLGGWLASLASLPLPWMIGAMTATTVAAMAGAQVALPVTIRNTFVTVLGVMLGSGFHPGLLAHLGDWTISLAMLLVYCLLSGGAGFLYFRRFCGYNPPTAYFAAMPGGLVEMILTGSAAGGDPRIISLSHAARVLIVVMLLPVGFQLLLDYDPATRPPAGAPIAEVAWQDLLLLAAAAVAGTLLARAVRLPAAQLVGPMLVSAAIHLAGWTQATPPVELVSISQVVIGAAIGCRFAGTSTRFVLRCVRLAAGATLLMLAVTLAVAYLVNSITGLPSLSLILAYAPGGLAEMSLVALALALDAAFVATHHITRILMVVLLAPLFYRLAGPPAAVPAEDSPR